MKSLAVFCGSQFGTNPLHTELARTLGTEMAQRGITLVYGGGRVGLMGVIATAVMEAGGKVVGVIPQSLAEKEIAFEGATELIVVGTMHQRKAIMADRADAFVALPGGYGTCDELFEILTWAQIGIHAKPIVLLNVAGFYNPLLTMVDHMTAEGFIRPQHRALLQSVNTLPELFAKLEQVPRSEPTEKWAMPDER